MICDKCGVDTALFRVNNKMYCWDCACEIMPQCEECFVKDRETRPCQVCFAEKPDEFVKATWLGM